MMLVEQPILLFLALVALYSPVAALPSYFPVVGQLGAADQRRLALGLVVNVASFAMVALWVGEPLLQVLGLSTAALTATGGIALLYEGVALMRGTAHAAPEQADGTQGDEPTPVSKAAVRSAISWRTHVFVPVTFPLTVGGTTFAFFVTFSAQARSVTDLLLLSVAGLAYALVTGATVYAAGHIHRRASAATAAFLDRLSGIILTAIAVTILTNGMVALVEDALS